MPKTNFQYDESGTTFYYVLLTFLGFILIPSTFFFWPQEEKVDPEKKKKYHAHAKETIYWEACLEKGERLEKKDPWKKTRGRFAISLIFVGWIFFAMIIYQISQFDYEMANFDPYEILQVSMSADKKTIKSQYKKLSLIYHPDKPTGDEKLFMKLRKAFDALTDETARYNWEHYGNPDGPQAMQFGIGLPAWIVEEKNSVWVLGVYTLIFMIGLPTAVWYWWSRSSKFSSEQVLLDTTQLYYYFFHKTPHMMLRRVLMVLAASLEFEKGHNYEIVERPTDNAEIPQLMKCLPNLGVNNKEKPLCFGYSVKARCLLFAHLSRIPLSKHTLHQDRLYIIKKCPYLIHEMVQCISQLILLAHAGRIARLPSLDTVEATMRCSSLVVQALWDKSSPLLQLPHVEEDMLKYFHSRKRNIKSLKQFAQMKEEDRRSLLRSISDEQYKDVIKVLGMMPSLSMNVTTEVVDDEEQHVVTAGAIITVTVSITRDSMSKFMSDSYADFDDEIDHEELDPEDAELVDEEEDPVEGGELEAGDAEKEKEEEERKKGPAWKKTQQKKKTKKPGKAKSKAKPKGKDSAQPVKQNGEVDKSLEVSSTTNRPNTARRKFGGESGSESDGDESASEESGSEGGARERGNGAAVNSEEDEEDQEWARFQNKLNKREKALEGKSKVSHSVHCPYFTDDKQEYWWVYICDRKTHSLVTPPYHLTGLQDQEEVELKFTAPGKPGHYGFTVVIRSDSYIGLDLLDDIKLDVKEAREAPTEHPQWEFEDEEEEDDEKEASAESEFATDDDYEDDSD